MYYSDSHEWIKIEGKNGKVGISNHAKEELGEIVYVQLPELGQKIVAGEEIVVLESNKAAADIYSPVSGVITSINEKLKDNVSLINNSPETDGYLFEIEIRDFNEIKKLFSKKEYLLNIGST